MSSEKYRQRYTIYHSRASVFESAAAKWAERACFPSGFDLVGTIEADSPLEAFTETVRPKWEKQRAVLEVFHGFNRGSRAGDVVEDERGRRFVFECNAKPLARMRQE